MGPLPNRDRSSPIVKFMAPPSHPFYEPCFVMSAILLTAFPQSAKELFIEGQAFSLSVPFIFDRGQGCVLNTPGGSGYWPYRPITSFVRWIAASSASSSFVNVAPRVLQPSI